MLSKVVEPALHGIMNLPKKANGFADTTGKACVEASGGVRGGAGHALGVDPGCQLQGGTRLSS